MFHGGAIELLGQDCKYETIRFLCSLWVFIIKAYEGFHTVFIYYLELEGGGNVPGVVLPFFPSIQFLVTFDYLYTIFSIFKNNRK